MVTIKQIAEELGISPTTVSNVINGRTGKMSAETRKKIEEALWKYHYEVAGKSGGMAAEENMIAVGFCMGQNKNVLTDPFCGELLGAIQRAVKEYGRYIVIDVPETEEDLVRLCAPWNIDGAIVLGWNPEQCSRLQKKMGKPLVFIDSCFEDNEEYDNIGLQDYEGAFELISYLLRLGHRSIAFFSDQEPPLASNRERLKGYQDALKAYGLPFSQEDFFFLPENKTLRHEVLRQFARKDGRNYSAAFFVSDYYANEAISVFYSKGLHVPEDISVTGFDDNIYARLSRPALTTVRQLPEEKGKQAVDLLMKRIRGADCPVRSLSLPTELIVRESTRAVFPSDGQERETR